MVADGFGVGLAITGALVGLTFGAAELDAAAAVVAAGADRIAWA